MSLSVLLSRLYPGQGFAEIVHHRTTVKSCCTDAETGEVGSFGAQVQAPPEVSLWECLTVTAQDTPPPLLDQPSKLGFPQRELF